MDRVSGGEDGVSLRQHVESILEEKDRALSMAESEREKAAAALRNEQQRREDQAGEEREKAASTLRVELARAIHEGDDRLREHIANQIMQIRDALISAEKLEVERLARLDARVDSVAETQEVLRQAAKETQAEFKADVKDRFASVNEFRNALDDLGKQMATRRELEGSQVTNNEKHESLQKQITELTRRLDVGPEGLRQLQTGADVARGRQTGIGTSAVVIVGAVTLVSTILGIVIVLANVLTSN